MMRVRKLGGIGACILVAMLLGGAEGGGCSNERLTREEAKRAMDETALAARAAVLTSNSVSFSTHFTIGEAVETAAEELRAFIGSQMPCAEVMLSENTLTVNYGAVDGKCTYRGQTWSGMHTITIVKNQRDRVVVRHEWSDFQNGEVSVDGSAKVTWDFEAKTRRVVHETTWTDLDGGRKAMGAGDRKQEPLEGSIPAGIRVAGTRNWSGESGEWALTIDDVEMRWTDPVPQMGRYMLETPFGKTLALGFERLDGDTIEVIVTGPTRQFDFEVDSRTKK